MFMDRNKPAFPKMQVGFIEIIVRPLLESYWGWLRSLKPIAEPLLLANIDYWKRKQAESDGQGLRADVNSPPSGGAPLNPPVTPMGEESSPARRSRTIGYRMRTLARQASTGASPSGVEEQHVRSTSPNANIADKV